MAHLNHLIAHLNHLIAHLNHLNARLNHLIACVNHLIGAIKRKMEAIKRKPAINAASSLDDTHHATHETTHECRAAPTPRRAHAAPLWCTWRRWPLLSKACNAKAWKSAIGKLGYRAAGLGMSYLSVYVCA